MKIKNAVNFFFLAFHRESGATTLPLAIMFPILLMCFSFALDGAHFQANRARLADAMNQGVLAVAINDRCDYLVDKDCAVKPGNQAANEMLLRRYLKYYLPNVIFTDNDLDVIVKLNRDNANKLTSIDYNASGIATLHPIFKKYNEIGFDHNVHVHADSSAGTVRKSMEQKSPPTDFVFVVDVSSSMGKDINGGRANSKDYIKYELLKKAVVSFSQTILNGNEKNTIGIVPFNVGVPVKLSKKNIFGGNETGCSFVGEIKKDYAKVGNKKVNFDFWYNKNFHSDNKDIDWQDKKLTDYYKSIVSPGLRITMDQMVDNKGWCARLPKENSLSPYSCDADFRANVRAGSDEYYLHYDKVEELVSVAKKRSNVVNIDTIDFDKTLKDEYLFSDDSVTTYTYFPYDKYNGLFQSMCFEKEYVDEIPNNQDDGKIKDFVNFSRKRVSPRSYLIELTSNANIVSHFQEMEILGGNTDSSSGLLRALPVIAKGNNPKKVIIMVTDGADSGGPKLLAEALHRKYHICERIKEGLLNYNKVHKTEEVEIFFISLAKKGVNDENVKFWRDHCVGDGNAFVVNDYSKLVNILAKISKKEKINFIDKNGFGR